MRCDVRNCIVHLLFYFPFAVQVGIHSLTICLHRTDHQAAAPHMYFIHVFFFFFLVCSPISSQKSKYKVYLNKKRWPHPIYINFNFREWLIMSVQIFLTGVVSSAYNLSHCFSRLVHFVILVVQLGGRMSCIFDPPPRRGVQYFTITSTRTCCSTFIIRLSSSISNT